SALNESKETAWNKELKFSFQKVSTRDMVIMTRQLSTMMAAGLSILRCLKILGEQTANRKLKKAILTIRGDIEEGQALWQAMSRHPDIFSDVYISMVRAGELGGILETVLDRLGDHLEREQEISAKIKSASIYPAIITVFAVLVVFFIITFVMPTFVNMFKSSGVEIPLPTRILLACGLFLKKSWLFILAGIFLLSFIFKKWGQTSSGRLILDSLYLRIPVLGKTISRITVARFARTMGTLVRSGIPILQCLEAVEDVVGNAVIKRAIRKARASISEGDSITAPLEETGVFEPMVTQMIAVGEETGSLDEMLVRMSEYFEREVIYMVDALMAVVEPLMILMVALLVGGVVVATLLPIFEIMNVVA
ncbi:MAG: type II secretion system F family protein, partial [Syntrophomonadaceae bacterium]|nr:type II secretion system F family protein [Syntrophomonadaceae bacterium]